MLLFARACVYRAVPAREAGWRDNDKGVGGDRGINAAVLGTKSPRALRMNWEKMGGRTFILAPLTPARYLTFSTHSFRKCYPSHDGLNLNWVMAFNTLPNPPRQSSDRRYIKDGKDNIFKSSPLPSHLASSGGICGV